MIFLPATIQTFTCGSGGILETRKYEYQLASIRPRLKQQYLLPANKLIQRQLALDIVLWSTKILFTICLKSFGQNS
jgi:hypothetical protein